MEEFDELRKRADKAEQDLARLRLTAQVARRTDDNQILCDAVRTSIPIVQFAVANLSPTFQKNWPTEKLREYANALAASPVADSFNTELAQELKVFADEADQLARERRARAEAAASD